MLPFLYVFLFFNVVLASLGRWEKFNPWRKNLLERGNEPTCSCTDPAAAAWTANQVFSESASSAVVPAGYYQAFKDGHAWNSGDGFIGYTIIDQYDNSICASICDSIDQCSSFQIYFEQVVGNTIPTIKCSFSAGAITLSAVKNANAIVAGVNGYTNSSISTPKGFEVPTFLSGSAIHPPSNEQTFLGSQVFYGSYDTANCADACDSAGCNFFNTYVLSKDGVSQGQYCDLYSQVYGTQYATETGSSAGGSTYTISHSFTFGWAGDQRDGGRSASDSPGSNDLTGTGNDSSDASWDKQHPWHGSQPYAGPDNGNAENGITGASNSATITSTSTSSILTASRGQHGQASDRLPSTTGSESSVSQPSSPVSITTNHGHQPQHTSQLPDQQTSIAAESDISHTSPLASSSSRRVTPTSTDTNTSTTAPNSSSSHPVSTSRPHGGSTPSHSTTKGRHQHADSSMPLEEPSIVSVHTTISSDPVNDLPAQATSTTGGHGSSVSGPTGRPSKAPSSRPPHQGSEPSISFDWADWESGKPTKSSQTLSRVGPTQTLASSSPLTISTIQEVDPTQKDPTTSASASLATLPTSSSASLNAPVVGISRPMSGPSRSIEWAAWESGNAWSRANSRYSNPTQQHSGVGTSSIQLSSSTTVPAPTTAAVDSASTTTPNRGRTSFTMHWEDWDEPTTTTITKTTTTVAPVVAVTESTATRGRPHWPQWPPQWPQSSATTTITTTSLPLAATSSLGFSSSAGFPTAGSWPSHSGNAWSDWTKSASSESSTSSEGFVAGKTSTSTRKSWPQWPPQFPQPSQTSSSTTTALSSTTSLAPIAASTGSVGRPPFTGAWPSESGSVWLDWLKPSTSSTTTRTTHTFTSTRTTTLRPLAQTSASSGRPPFAASWPSESGSMWLDWTRTKSSLRSTIGTSTKTSTTSTTALKPLSPTTGSQIRPPFSGSWPSESGSIWLDWVMSSSSGRQVTSSSVRTTTSTKTTIAVAATSASPGTSMLASYPSYSGYNGSSHSTWGGWPAENGSLWLDWTRSATSTSYTTSTLKSVAARTTASIVASTSPVPVTSSAASTISIAPTTSANPVHPNLPTYNGSTNGTWGNWTNLNDTNSIWLDWIMSSSSVTAKMSFTSSKLQSAAPTTSTTSTLKLSTATTSTAGRAATTSGISYPSGGNWTTGNWTSGNWTNFNDTNSMWLDWIASTSSSKLTTSTSKVPVAAVTTSSASAPVTTTSSQRSLAAVTTGHSTFAHPTIPPYNATGNWTAGNYSQYGNDTNSMWLDWNFTAPSATSSSRPFFLPTSRSGTVNSTSASSSVSASTSKWASTSTSSADRPAAPSPTTFYVTSGSLSRSKRSEQYLGFSHGNGVFVSSQAAATLFSLDSDGHLRVDSLYVNADITQPYLIFSLVSTPSNSLSRWTRGSTGVLSSEMTTSYTCVDGQGTVYLVFDGSTPFVCSATVLDTAPVALAITSSSAVSTMRSSIDHSTSRTTTQYVKTTAVPGSRTSAGSYPSPGGHSSYNGTNNSNATWADWIANSTVTTAASATLRTGNLTNGNWSSYGNDSSSVWLDWLSTTSSTVQSTKVSTSASIGSSSAMSTSAFVTPSNTRSTSAFVIPTIAAHPLPINVSHPGNFTYPGGNFTYPAANSSLCDATPPTQLLQNPSFECSIMGWTLEEVEIVWGGVPSTAAPSKTKRDISSSDTAYEGKGFARFMPSFEDATATLSQTLTAPATNGSYWYSFAYRVPFAADTSTTCFLTVSSNEGIIATVSALPVATAWTMTGKEFQIVESASTFSFIFSCDGVSSPMLDIDDIKLGISSGNWTSGSGSVPTYTNSTGLPTWVSAPLTNGSFIGNSSTGYGAPFPSISNETRTATSSNSSKPLLGSGLPYEGSGNAKEYYAQSGGPPSGNAYDGVPTSTSSVSKPTATILAAPDMLRSTSTTTADVTTSTTTSEVQSSISISTTTIMTTSLTPTTTSDAANEEPTLYKRHRYHKKST